MKVLTACLRVAGVAAVLAGLMAAPAMADKPHRWGRAETRWHHLDKRWDDQWRWMHRHDDRRRSLLDRRGEYGWRREPPPAWAARASCPPGLAKKNIRCLPPGQARWAGPVRVERRDPYWRDDLRAVLWRLLPPPYDR